MSTQHKEVMLKQVVGGTTWKGRCICGENFRGKLKKDVEAEMKAHMGDGPAAEAPKEDEAPKEAETSKESESTDEG